MKLRGPVISTTLAPASVIHPGDRSVTSVASCAGGDPSIDGPDRISIGQVINIPGLSATVVEAATEDGGFTTLPVRPLAAYALEPVA